MPKFQVTVAGLIHASYSRTVTAPDEESALEKVRARAREVGPRKFDLDWQGDELDEESVEMAL